MNANNLTKQKQRTVFFRLLTYLKAHPKMLTIAFILLILTTSGEVIGPILIKIFIDDYLTPQYLPVRPLVILGLTYIFIQIAKGVIAYFQSLIFQTVALKIIQQLRVDVFSKVQNLGLRYFDRTPVGAIISRVTNDTEAIKDLFVEVLVVFIQNGFLLIGILIAMFALNTKLALFCLLTMPLLFLIILTYRKYSTKFYQNIREQLSHINAKLNESINGMAIIQVFRQEQRLRNQFEITNDEHYEASLKNIKLDSLLLRPAIDLVYTIAIVIVLVYFGVTSFTSPVEIGVLYAFVNYLERFFKPVNQIMMRLSKFQQAIVAGSRVFNLIDETEIIPQQQIVENAHIDRGEIEFRNVSFSYDGERQVLKNISFRANKGETIAFVGHTGSGKSTIINLLMRFYEFQCGEIFIDGHSIKHYPRSELRQRIGLVLQDPFLFYGTIADNIKLHNDEITLEQVKAAAEFVQADQFIDSLTNNYNHRVIERGAAFSSGQRQLIAFARTMATNPKILLLDEATANIDTETEDSIQIALNKMRSGRTTIAIAHRLSTVQDADHIYVLHRGEIVESGTHQQLLTKRGLYYKMYLLQNNG